MGCINLEEVVYEYETDKTIPMYCFCNCSKLTTFIDKGEIENVENYSFASTGIKEIVLSHAEISEYAFENSKIEVVTFASIKNYLAFQNCKHLEKLIISEYADGESINAENFRGLEDIDIELEAGHPTLNIWNDILLYNYSQIVFLLPKFSTKKLEIPSNITTIRNHAFALNKKIKTLIMSNFVKLGPTPEESSSIFYNISYSPSIKEIEISFKEGNFSLLSQFGFFEKLEKVTITTPINDIGDYVFQYCPKLEKVELPSSCTILADYAFKDCESLSKINLDHIVEFGTGAMRNTSITTFDFSKFEENTTVPSELLRDCKKLKEVTGTATFTTISSYAFYGCESLKTVSFPKVKSIESYAFAECYKLESFDFSKVTKIDERAFQSCKKLTSISITNYTTCSEYIFSDCHSLKTLELTGLNEIPENAFAKCYKLNEVKFSSNLMKIGSGSFSSCGFKELTIPDSVISIGENAFFNNTNLKTVTLGKGLCFINANWFKFSSLKKLIIPPSLKSIGQQNFNFIDDLEIEFSSPNQIYGYESNTLYSKIDYSIVSTIGFLDKVYEIPEIIKRVKEYSILRFISTKYYLSYKEDHEDGEAIYWTQSNGIASAAIIKVPSNQIQFDKIMAKEYPDNNYESSWTYGGRSIHLNSICYEGEYPLTEGQYLENYFGTENYLYDELLGSTYSNKKCSTKLADAFKWRHIYKMSSAEIGLTAFVVIAVIIVIILVVLIILKKASGGGSSSKNNDKKSSSGSAKKDSGSGSGGKDAAEV